MRYKDVLNNLTEDWNELKEIVIYGYGRVARRNIKKLSRDFSIKYIVDNYLEHNLCSELEWEVRKFSQVRDELGRYKIIVATAASAYESIKRDLESIGLKEYRDFCRIEIFFVEWYWKNKNMVCLSQLNSSVTSRCSFNCKHCATLMPYFKQQYEYTKDDIMEDLSLLFERVDYLASYYLVGGEPLLNKNLSNIIEAVYECFGEKMGCMQIISNGSIAPDKKLLSALKNCNVDVRLSDYTDEIAYGKKFKDILNMYRSEGINCVVNKFDWVDLGFPNKIECMGNDIQSLQRHMRNCSTGCHALNDKKFFYCGTLFYAEKSGLYKLKESDYIDLTQRGERIEDKKRLLKYCLGEIGTEYITLCQYCRGFGADNTYFVKAAEQITRNSAFCD